MSLFKPDKEKSGQTPPAADSVPVVPFDISRRYDIYCSLVGSERVYENVRITCIRTFERISEYSSGALCGLLEIEAANGTRMLIPQHGIQMICETGAAPTFRVLPRSEPLEDDLWRSGS